MENTVKGAGSFVKIVIVAVAFLLCGVGAFFAVKYLMPKSIDNLPMKYVAVQSKEGGDWSIMDADGNIIVSKEYDGDCEISLVSQGGAYWVKSANSGKYKLFSIDSPERSLGDPYDNVTNFFGDIAFASISGKPIVVVNEEGEVLVTLSEDIKQVTVYSADNDRAAYCNNEGEWGYINRNGQVAIEAQYNEVYRFSEGYALVYPDSTEKSISIIDINGNEITSIDAEVYKPTGNVFSDGLLGVKMADEEEGLVFINPKGEVVLDCSNKYSRTSGFKDGYAVVANSDREAGIIDAEGNEVLRLGKFDIISVIGDGLFFAGKEKENFGEYGYEMGVIDAEGKKIITFDYVDGFCIGDNFLMERANGTYAMFDRNGEKIATDKIVKAVTYSYLWSVDYINVDGLADAIISKIDKSGFVPFAGKTNVAELAPVYNLKVEDYSTYSSYVSLEKIEVEGHEISLYVDFSENIIDEVSHWEEVQRDNGWYRYTTTERVVDGYEWNEDSRVNYVELRVDLKGEKECEALNKKLVAGLKDKGFEEQYDGCYQAENGEYRPRVNISASYNSLTLTFYPYYNYYY